jgi:hypothetical protein
MPPQTRGFNEHGVVQARITRHLDQAEDVFLRFAAARHPPRSIDRAARARGVRPFVKSFDSLIESLESKRRELVT